jgi:hypothetical protein
MGKKKPIGIVMADTGPVHKVYIGTGNGVDEKADAERIYERGAELKAGAVAHLLSFLDSGSFRVSTRTVYYCTYMKSGMEEPARTRAFQTLEEAREHATVLVQHGCEGMIEKHREWSNPLFDRSWHLDIFDPDATETIEHFPER